MFRGLPTLEQMHTCLLLSPCVSSSRSCEASAHSTYYLFPGRVYVAGALDRVHRPHDFWHSVGRLYGMLASASASPPQPVI